MEGSFDLNKIIYLMHNYHQLGGHDLAWISKHDLTGLDQFDESKPNMQWAPTSIGGLAALCLPNGWMVGGGWMAFIGWSSSMWYHGKAWKFWQNFRRNFVGFHEDMARLSCWQCLVKTLTTSSNKVVIELFLE